MSKPTKQQLEALAKQINRDQNSSSPAEKRLKLNVPFTKAVKKIVRVKPPKKR